MKNNADNKKKIFDVNSNVYSNKTLIFHLISKIEENRSMILNNFYSAFSINTTLTIENFDEIFKNRDPSKAIPPLYGALVKNEQDVQLLERLAFMARREGNTSS